MIRRSTVRLPVAVLITIGAAIVATMTGRADAAILAAPWMALLVLGFASARHQKFQASISLAADRVVTGDDVQVNIRVRAGHGWVEVRCRPEASFWSDGLIGPDAIPVPVADVVSRGQVHLRSSFRATAWGSHDIGRVEIQVHEPYGLFAWTGTLEQPTIVRVHPSSNELRSLLAPWMVRRLTGAHSSTAVDRGIEYADIRPFASGDSLRDINWRASARSDELWVSQRHPERATDVVLLLDSFVESGHDVRAAVGLGIEAAVALAESHLAVTDRVGLVDIGGVVRWVTPGTGRLQLQRLTDSLLSTGLWANAAARDLVIPPRALPPRSFIVALSPLFDQRFIDTLFTLRGGGHDVAVIDCSRVEEYSAAKANETEVSRLARRLWLAERGITRDRLAERGIAVSPWTKGSHLNLVVADLTRLRHQARRMGSR